MERGFLSSGGRGDKQKKGANTVNSLTNKENKDDDLAKDRVNEAMTSNFSTHHASANEEDNVNVGTVNIGSHPPLPTHETISAGNAPGKSSYANVTGKPSGTKVDFHTLFTPGGNGIDVVVLVESIRAISERFFNTAYGFFSGKRVAYLVVANYVRNTWDVNLLKEDVGTVPVWVKLHGVPVTAFSEDGLSVIATKLGTPLMLDSYTSDMCMQSWGRSRYARAMIEVRADVELKDNIIAAMPKINEEGYYTCTGETMNMKKTSQIPNGFSVGQKMGFKPKQVYQYVSKKATANTSTNKNKNVDPPKENAELSSPSTTPSIEKINKMENLIIDGKAILVDNEGKPLRKVSRRYSWASRMLLYIKDKEHGRLLADSVLNGPFQYETIVEPGNENTPATIKARTYTDLTDDEKILVHQQPYQAPTLQQSYQVPAIQQPSTPSFPQLDSGLAVPSFNPSDDPISNLNKMEESPFRQFREDTQGYVNIEARSNATSHGVNKNEGVNTTVQARVVKYYNYQEEGHMARQCTKPKRPKNSSWFKEKMLLTEALESGAYLDPKQLAFLADNEDTFTLVLAS
ncbi:retrotransposon protein, putative, ty1-copia subclass [Tanacetum coccineum]|uniref:Retrotransposon protein, putative, ty1-copia subclass n=1 Tax=Tanacetum coccineum TaxID=301880 RepID=A0ABQ5GPD2_9ASTR